MEEINRLHDIADDLDRTMWGHELADALHNIAAHIGEEVDRMRDLSGYESDVMAWVEKNGGLDAVREQRRESIPRAAYERKKAGWLDHIEECEEALARRNGRIAELRRERDKLRDEAAWAESLSEILDEWADLLGFPEQKGDPGKITARVSAVLDGTWRRLMPEGCEWPRYEDGEPVPLGGEVTVTVHDKDGDFDRTFAIRSIKYKESGVLLEGTKNEMVILSYGERVRRPPVLAADGEPLEVGQTVYLLPGEWCGEFPLRCYSAGDEMVIKDLRPNHEVEGVLKCAGDGKCTCFPLPCQLTHTKPEPPDTWERIEDDATLSPEVYCHRNGIDISQKDGTEIFLADTVEPMARDLVRRCREVAERERGE